MGNMRLSDYEITKKIAQFLSVNAGCGVRILDFSLGKQLRVSPNRISNIYHTMIYDEEKNPHGLIVVEKSAGFRGGNDQFKLFLKETELKKQKEESLDKYALEVLDILKKSGNRLTQKELREKISSIGEAKISLILNELEAAGKIKKIKKGRGNIIILKE